MDIDTKLLKKWLKDNKHVSTEKLLEYLKYSLQNVETSGNWNYYPGQIIVKSKNFYYKFYFYPKIFKFNSIVRKAIADVYTSYGIHWELETLDLDNGNCLDIEEREILTSLTGSDDWLLNEQQLRSYSKTLLDIELKLGLPDLAKQLSKIDESVSKLKLLRNDPMKASDFAIYNDKLILLDDDDFFICMVSPIGEILTCQTYLQKVIIGEDEFLYKGYKQQHDWTSGPTFKFFPVLSTAEYLMTDVIESESDTKLKEMVDLFLEEDKTNENNVVYTSEELDCLYKNNYKRKSFQWELWQQCNTPGCLFCYLGTDNRHTNKERQLKSLHDFNLAIDKLDFKEYNNISIIGGEFFQGQLADKDVKEEFFKTIKRIFMLYKEKKLGSIWVAATLTRGDQKDLYEMLDLAKAMCISPNINYGESGLWICTSWDAYGRFHDQKMKDTWEYNMKKISKEYPFVRKNTTIILTQAMIDMYLNDEFDPQKFSVEFNTSLFYKQPGVPLNCIDEDLENEDFDKQWMDSKAYLQKKFNMDFYPKRASFIKFLKKYKEQDESTFNKLFNIKFRADELHRNANDLDYDEAMTRNKDSKQEEGSVQTLPCGHLCYYAPYIDSNKCCICDRDIIKESC